jgi:hypothetical protein
MQLGTLMRLSRFAKAALQVAIMLSCGNVCAADQQGRAAGPAATIALPAVQVSALRDPVEKSYRKIVKGMDLFEQRRSLAPGASLRFKLLPRNRDTEMERINLTLVGDNVDIPIPVAADNTFALERSRQALEEDALVVPNRRARSMTWRADIRTPGLPLNTRRLGDLRLECLVGLEAGLVSNTQSFIDGFLRLIEDRDYCERRVPSYLFFAERPLWSVTLVHGSRRKVLPVDEMYAGISREPTTPIDLRYCDCEVLLDRTYYAPLGDRNWPDDTLLEFEYLDAGVATAAPAAAPEERSR